MPSPEKQNHEQTQARRSAETDEAMQNGRKGGRQAAEEFRRIAGLNNEAQKTSQHVAHNLDAIAQTSAVLSRGFQEVSKEWLDLWQSHTRRNVEAMTRIAQCRTVPDALAIQSDLVLENLHGTIDLTRRVAERAMQVVTEAEKQTEAERPGRYPSAVAAA